MTSLPSVNTTGSRASIRGGSSDFSLLHYVQPPLQLVLLLLFPLGEAVGM
jgi:hypothetical protein